MKEKVLLSRRKHLGEVMSKYNVGQQKALDTKGNILISASAGSGKTTVMIEKIMNLVLEKHDLKRILVMTFSRASANEMKERLVSKIYDYLRKGEGDKEFLLKQLDSLPFSNISTIDSFCKSMFNKYFSLGKRDPSAKMLEPEKSVEILHKIIDREIETRIENKDKEFLALLNHIVGKTGFDALKSNIIQARNFFLIQPNLEEYLVKIMAGLKLEQDSPMVEYIVSYYNKELSKKIDVAKELLVLLQDCQKAEKHIICVENFLEFCKNIDTMEGLSILADFFDAPNRFSKGKGLNEAQELYNKWKPDFSTLKKFTTIYKDKEASKKNYEESIYFVNLVLNIDKKYLEYKRKYNLLDFSDLNSFMLKILENKEAREEIKQSFDYIFVDEYQDTNYMQEKYLQDICKKDNIFVVGDVKQSIYHFRYTEPKIFCDRMDYYNATHLGENINLNENYRSNAGILDFANKIFSEVMTTDLGGVDYKNTAKLVAGKEFRKVNNLPIVEIAIDSSKKEEESLPLIYSVKNAKKTKKSDVESQYIAEKILSIVGKEKLYVAKSDEVVDIKYSDIAVLVKKRSLGKKVIEAFKEAKIPYFAGDISEGDSVEINTLVDIIRVIKNMRQDKPLFVSMLSGLGGFSHKELLEIHSKEPKLQFYESVIRYNAEDKIYIKIQNFVNKLEEYRKLANYYKVSELLGMIIADGVGFDFMKKSPSLIKKVNLFISKIVNTECDKDIDDFLEYYDNTYEGVTNYAEGDAVTISTIHKSKGLEYPIVFLPYTGENRNGGKKGDIILDNDLGMAIKSYNDEDKIKESNFATEVMSFKNKVEECEEMARLYYVALTRAQNHLFISGKEIQATKEYNQAICFMDWLKAIKENSTNTDLSRYYVDIVLDEAVQEDKAIITREDDVINLDKLNFSYPYKEATKMPSKYSVTQLLKEGREVQTDIPNKRVVKKEVGSMYHTIMQYIDFNIDTEEGVKNFVLKLIDEKFLDEQAKDLDMSIILNCLASPLVNYAKNNPHNREQSFLLSTNMLGEDKVLVQGIIDLVIFGEETILVDYKTSFGSPKQLIERYSKQMELYKEAIEKITKKRVDKVFIFNILKNNVIEIKI